MLEAVQALLPTSVAVHHLGMYREKTTLQPVEYYNNLPYHKEGGEGVPELAIIVDPIIATGSTVCAAIDTLRDWGVPRIIALSVLAAEGGLRRAAESWPDGVELWVGGVDAETDERGMVRIRMGRRPSRFSKRLPLLLQASSISRESVDLRQLLTPHFICLRSNQASETSATDCSRPWESDSIDRDGSMARSERETKWTQSLS